MSLPSLISAQDLAEHLDDANLRIFDATIYLDRPPEGGRYTPVARRAEYERAHIPGAAFVDIPVDLSDPGSPLLFTLPSPTQFAAAAGRLGIGDSTHVVVYTQDGPMWATRLWWLLRYFGFDAVSVLDGGLPAWQAAALPVSAGPDGHPPAIFTPQPRPELLAERADVEAISAAGGAGTCLINALAPRVFRGEGPTAYSRAGRIPGSVNAPWESIVEPGIRRFLPLPELRAAFEAVGALGPEPVVAYCGGGISATVDIFALHLLGRDDVRLYDGSLAEWTADPMQPVEVG